MTEDKYMLLVNIVSLLLCYLSYYIELVLQHWLQISANPHSRKRVMATNEE